MAVTSIAASLDKARDLSYLRLANITLEGSHHRTDIGYRAL